MLLIGINCNGIIETHIPDYSGNYETFCGLDGNDTDKFVNQLPAKAGSRVDCPQCIAAWKLARKIKPSMIKEEDE